MNSLQNIKIAFLVTDGFEQVELTGPKDAVEKQGAKTMIVSLDEGEVKGWDETNWGDKFKVDITLDQTSAESFDGLVLPGGQINPDLLRVEDKAIQFIKDFANSHKPIAAICHGPWTLIEAGLVEGKKMTSFPSIKTDLINAGANWVDEEVVEDGNIITSRNPDDIPAFNQAFIKALEEVTANH